MTDLPGPSSDPRNAAAPARTDARRNASVTLRGSGAQQGDGLDAASQSLAEALTLVSRVLNFAMLALAVVFILSGLSSIRENEVGLRLVFGKVSGERLPPGFQFSLPYPIGELLKVDTGVVAEELDEPFWPKMDPQSRARPLQEQVNVHGRVPKPGEDGSHLTGDEALAHTRWRVVYQRRQPVDFLTHVLPSDERAIVRAAVTRAVTHAVAQVRIDDLLKQSSGDTGSIALRAQAMAQRFLDSLKTGIEITQLQLQDKAPPFLAYGNFSGVQSAEQKAARARNEAESRARGTLNEMAGEASSALIGQIDRLELALQRADEAEQRRAHDAIRALLSGEPADLGDGQPAARIPVSGRVAARLNEAREYASSVVNRRRAELASFESKLAQFRVNPSLVLTREWADAMQSMLGRDNVEMQTVPPSTRWYRLLVNRDPQLARDLERSRKEREVKAADDRRNRELNDQRFRTTIDTPLMER